MSQKKAKEHRKAKNLITIDIRITVTSGGQLTINGLPREPFTGMGILASAQQTACQKYQSEMMKKVKQAKSNVIPIETPIVGPDGKRLN